MSINRNARAMVSAGTCSTTMATGNQNVVLGNGSLEFVFAQGFAADGTPLPSLNMHMGHVSLDPTVVSHCVFCGSGAVVGRGDGGVECQLCNRSFSVMEQPLFSNMPATDPGANVESTPFDPLQQQDPFDPGTPAPGTPGTPGVPAAQPAAALPGAQPAPAALPPAKPNPFAGKLVARNGTELDEEEFILHHAIRLARELTSG